MQINFFSGKSDLNEEALAAFSTQEEYEFLLQNGKYNKRNSSDIQTKINELQTNLKLNEANTTDFN